MASLRWWRGFALGGLLMACFLAPAAAQTSTAYTNAVNMNAQYRKNQAQLAALRQTIANNEAARARWRREIDEAGPSVGKLMLLPQYTDSFAAANRAIESDRATLVTLERRQSILERSWSNNGMYSGYYGDLRETANRTIYDPQTRKTVNLMDYRVANFREPDRALKAANPLPNAESSKATRLEESLGRAAQERAALDRAAQQMAVREQQAAARVVQLQA